MAYGQFGIFDKPASSYGTPREHLNVLRAAAMERANYLSNMDAIYARLDEERREFNKSLAFAKEKFAKELGWSKEKFEREFGLREEELGIRRDELGLQREGLAQQAAQCAAGLEFQKEQFDWQKLRWRSEFDYSQELDTWKRGYYQSEQDRSRESDWWTRGFGLLDTGIKAAEAGRSLGWW